MIQDFSKLNCELQTERLFLRPLQVSDAEAMWSYVSDPDFPKYMTWEAHKDINETKEFLQGKEKEFADAKSVVWSIFMNDAFVGLIGLEGVKRYLNTVKTDRAELGYWLGSKFWGQGIMLEAGKAVLRFGFEEMELHKVTVGHFSENPQSQRVIEKLGFRLVGLQKEHFHKNGKWHDHYVYEMLRNEFTKE